MLLYSFTERKIALEHLLHHVDCMDDTLCNGVFRFVSGAVGLMRVLLPLIRGYVLKLVRLFLEKFVYFLLVFDNPLGDDLPMLNDL